MSIQTRVYGSFFSCLIKNFNETDQKYREKKTMEMEMKPRKCIYNNATRWIHASRKTMACSCSRMTLISFNLLDGMESFPGQKKILSSF